MKAFCDEQGIVVTAYSPLGSGGVGSAGTSVVQNEVLATIGAKYGASCSTALLAAACARHPDQMMTTFILLAAVSHLIRSFISFSVSRARRARVRPSLTNTQPCICLHTGKSAAQVAIAWCVSRGVVCIPKSVTAARLAANFDVFFEVRTRCSVKHLPPDSNNISVMVSSRMFAIYR